MQLWASFVAGESQAGSGTSVSRTASTGVVPYYDEMNGGASLRNLSIRVPNILNLCLILLLRAFSHGTEFLKSLRRNPVETTLSRTPKVRLISSIL